MQHPHLKKHTFFLFFYFPITSTKIELVLIPSLLLRLAHGNYKLTDLFPDSPTPPHQLHQCTHSPKHQLSQIKICKPLLCYKNQFLLVAYSCYNFKFLSKYFINIHCIFKKVFANELNTCLILKSLLLLKNQTL